MSEMQIVPTEGFIKTKSGNIHYRYYGDKKSPIMACCNGFLMDMTSWDKLLPYMITRTDVLIWDYLGQGLSDIPEFNFPSVEDSATTLKEIITYLELDDLPLYILGMSHGGFVALEFAKMFPNSVKKIALMSTMIKTGLHSLYIIRAQLELVKQNQLSLFLQLFYAIIYNQNFLESINLRLEELTERFVEKYSDKNMALYNSSLKFLEYAEHTDEKELKKINIPIIGIYGEDDFLNPHYLKVSRESLLPQAKFFYIPETAHYPIIEKQKDFFNILDKFL